MFCTNCGLAFADTMGAFCPKCGAARGAQQISSPNHENPQSAGVPTSQPGKGKAIASLVLGIGAMTIPVPVLDIIIGIVGLILALSSKSDGYKGGLRIAGFVCSILGIIFATIYTIVVLAGVALLSADTFWMDPYGWGW